MSRKTSLHIAVLAIAAALAKDTGTEVRIGIASDQDFPDSLPFERSMLAPIHSAFNAPHQDPHRNPWPEARRRQHNTMNIAAAPARPRARSMSMR